MIQLRTDTRWPRYTRGWFQVAWSSELKHKQHLNVRRFDRDLILFRGENGVPRLLDAYCPHMGAHIGKGGQVVGNCIRCPFHGWKFNGDGACVEIPYARKIPPRARLGRLAVIERHGAIFAYFDPAGVVTDENHRAAFPDFPDLDDLQCAAQQTYTIKAHPLDILENAVDSIHFEQLHGNERSEVHIEQAGSALRVQQCTGRRIAGIRIPATLDYTLIEPGFHYLEFHDLPMTRAVVISSVVPEDNDTVVNYLAIWATRSPLLLRFPRMLLNRLLARQMKQVYVEDIPIWESKIRRDHLMLSDSDGPLGRLHRWYRQFTPSEHVSVKTAAHQTSREVSR